MKKLLPYFFLLCYSIVYGQKENNVWVFGFSAGLNFNSGSPVSFASNIKANEASAAACDENGQLLFYTNGSYVFDRNNMQVPNGNNLTGLTAAPPLDPTTSTSQGAAIVQVPDSLYLYYIFSNIEIEMGSLSGRLYYSVFDMRLNGGLGDIVPGKKGILFDSGLTEKMLPVLGDRCNIWLLVHPQKSPSFKAYEITAAGINFTPVISNAGTFSGSNYAAGTLKISPNRKRLAAANLSYGLEVFDFDAATGIVSNAQRLSDDGYYSSCFSPDNTKLYACSKKIEQYDLSLPTLAATVASKTIVSSGTETDMRLGSDNKIYYNGPGNSTGIPALSLISKPDIAGLGCAPVFNAISFQTGTSFKYGLGNVYPVYKKEFANASLPAVEVCFKDSVRLYANDSGWNYSWEDGSIQQYRTVYHSGKYIVRYYTAPCIFHTDTLSVLFKSYAPNMGAYSGCRNGQGSYLWITPNDTNNYTFEWADISGRILQTKAAKGGDTLSGVTTGTYFVKMKTANGCDTTYEIILPTSNYKSAFTGDTLLCAGDTAQFTNLSVNATGNLWLFGDGDTSTQFHAKHLYNDAGTFSVSLINYPCLDTMTAKIEIDSMPYVGFTVDSIPLCIGQAIRFNPVYEQNATKLVWHFGGDSLTTWRPTYDYLNAGQQIVTVMAHFRVCRDTSFSDTLVIGDYPLVNIGSDTTICNGQSPIQLYNHAAVNGNTHLWSTGATSNEISINAPGTYWLKVTAENGCTGADSVQIGNGCYIAIPNAFSPNGDGINDYFFPREILSESVARFSMALYNRWGQIVFETGNIDGRGWDGSLNGIPQPEGVYMYLITLSFANDVSEQHKGNVTLLR